MAKFCSKCGKELKDGARFCPACGAPVLSPGQGTPAPGIPNPGPISGGMNAGPNPGSMNINQGTEDSPGTGASSPIQSLRSSNLPLKPIAIGIGALLVVIILFSFIFGGKGYEKPIKYLEDGINKADMKTFLKAFDSNIADYYDYMDEDDFIEEMDGISISLDIVDKEKIDKDDLKEVLKEDYRVKAAVARKATAGYILEIEGELTEDDGDSDTAEFEIVVIKIDGEWKIPINFFL